MARGGLRLPLRREEDFFVDFFDLDLFDLDLPVLPSPPSTPRLVLVEPLLGCPPKGALAHSEVPTEAFELIDLMEPMEPIEPIEPTDPASDSGDSARVRGAQSGANRGWETGAEGGGLGRPPLLALMTGLMGPGAADSECCG